MKKITALFSIFFSCFFSVFANVSTFSITSFQLLNQLPSNSVQRIYQDKDGFIWLGTLDGLCRYDGYRILTFRSGVNNPKLLTNNEITSICEDTQNHIWIGTKKGLNILNKKTYEIRKVNIPDVDNIEIRDITVSSDGTIWIGTFRQVIRFNSDYSVKKIYNISLPVASVNGIYEDHDGNIWVTLWGKGLFLYDKEKDAFSQLPRLASTNNPFKIIQDKNKNIWIATWGDGIFLLNQNEDGSFFYSNPFPEKSASKVEEKNFFSIVEDDTNGYLWLTSISGLFSFKVKDDKTLQKIDISYLTKQTNNIFSEIIKDNYGNLWISSFSGGVYTVNFEKSVVKNHLLSSVKLITGINPNVTALYEHENKDIWFNQNRYGLVVLDTKTKKSIFYKDISDINKLNGLSTVRTITSFRSFPDEVWVAPEGFPVIYSMKKANNTIRLLYTIDLNKIAPHCGSVRLFFEDRKNNIWIITSNNIFIKPYKKKIQVIDLSIPTISISAITEDTKGSVWISSSESGLYQIINGGSKLSIFKINHYETGNSKLISNNIRTVCADAIGNVWIGTQEGNIVVYDILKEQFIDYSLSFKRINEGILNIVAEDECGHIWVSTNKRVIEYNPANKAAYEYSANDGLLISSFLKNSYYKNNSKKILFGGNNGIAVFLSSSDKLSKKAQEIKVSITDIKIDNRSVFYNNDNNRFNIEKQEIILEPYDKNIEIDFSSLTYIFPEKIQYAYKMEGIDDDWIYTKGDRQFAIYNRLSKGDNEFLLKATDENGLWSTNINRINFYKRPAFYETWWAYTFYFVLIFAIAYFTYRIIKNRIKLRNELKIAQIEKEKSEELTQSKLRYFTNITHDFMTPLTIVSCLIDDAEMTSKEKITQFDAMRSNIRRLRRLLQQVLDFRKVESGNMKLKLSYGDIVTFIRDICSTHFEPLMYKENIKFYFQTNQNYVQAFFDPDKIDKVIFNLLSNAYKYTPENGEVKVELEFINNYLVIKVSDTGIGIPKKEQEKIFTRFYTDSEGRTKDSNGIGLSLTRDLLELHRGSIRVESEVNQGATFIVKVPIDKDSYSVNETGNTNQMDSIEKKDLEQTANLVVSSEENKNEKAEKENINLLLVEDNEELLNVVCNILSKHYTVFTAINGFEALDIVKEHSINIIVSDVMMPEMDGLELARKLKNDLETSHIPILMLTAKNNTEDRIECYNAGADGYISKPFDLKVLEARINNFIAHKKNKQKEFKSNVDINTSTLEFTTFDEQFLNNAISLIEENISENELNLNLFAEKLNMSKSSLYRKLKTMTGLGPNEFIRNIRLKHACQLLKKQSASVSEVAYVVGFSDPKYFSYCFKNEFNMTPREYQKSLLSEKIDESEM